MLGWISQKASAQLHTEHGPLSAGNTNAHELKSDPLRMGPQDITNRETVRLNCVLCCSIAPSHVVVLFISGIFFCFFLVEVALTHFP